MSKGFTRIKTRSRIGLWWKLQWIIRFHKRQRIS